MKTKLLLNTLVIASFCIAGMTACDHSKAPAPASAPTPLPATETTTGTAELQILDEDMAPAISVTEIFTGKTVTLADFAGQVVLLDFWATWCGPCQGPMAHNQEIMTKHAEDWKGKAVIVGISIDDTIEAVKAHVTKKDWTAPMQLWSGDGWKDGAAKAYEIRGVPTAILIDKTGRIVWRGHPGIKNVEKLIEEYLAK